MNRIMLASRYSDLMNDLYAQSAKTAVLESDAALAREGANANEIVVPSLSMDGLADYSRNDGYVKGSVTLTWSTVRFNYERGRMFEVDSMDDEETQNIAFGRLAGEFLRTQAVPELDAFRFAQIASTNGISKVQGTFTDGEEVIAALRTAVSALDEAEVPDEDRILFISPEVMGMIEDMDTTKSRSVLSSFAAIVNVPAGRFFTAVTLYDGTSSGEEDGGFAKAANGKDINFLIVHKPAVLMFTKHLLSKIIPPENNPDSDAWRYAYRSYGLCSVFRNKTAGIYLHHRAT